MYIVMRTNSRVFGSSNQLRYEDMEAQMYGESGLPKGKCELRKIEAVDGNWMRV
jgi:hypothetical protein